VDADGHQLTVTELDGRRVARVLVAPRTEARPEPRPEPRSESQVTP
jgi:hypothetical protein